MSSRTIELTQRLYDYLLGASLREPEVLKQLRQETKAMKGAGMQISPEQGQFMALLAKSIGARRAIEIGVFTGYSALSVALALPADGRIIACDISEENVRIGIPFWQRAGVADRIDLRIAPAAETLRALLSAGDAGRHDFVFIDADKSSYDTYYELTLALLRPGGLVIIDNTLWGGAVARPADSDDTRALQALNAKVHRDERVDMVLLPFSDGVTLVRKR